MVPSIVLLFVATVQLVVSEEYVVPENIDVDEIIKNDRLVKSYIDCILEKGKCTPEGEKLRKAIPEALQDECAKCNDEQKEGVRKVIHYLRKNQSEWLKELEVKYDRNGEYTEKYKHLFEKEDLDA
ncbi:OS-D domain containing protein [Asbolus verrucosus]|uniref:OS-D domain containing protein n=1 Tax=Asbolus verrucosus TaxID=1661398 RepID=A0A482W328_ASBVE|nr:OS-D domain containing protein [Asbolus verrucosus]